MAKIVSRARQLRLDYQAKIGRVVPIEEVAGQIGITRAALSNIELNKTERIDFDTLQKLCTFYSQALEKKVNAADVLEYIPIQAPDLALA